MNVIGAGLRVKPSGRRRNHLDTENFISLYVWDMCMLPAGCSKWPSSKAAGSSATEAYFFFARPPRAARTALSPGGTLQGDGRLRTPHGKGRVSARRGWAGEKSDFFSILLGMSEEKVTI